MSKITGLEAPNQVPPKVTAMYRAVSTLLREDKDISEMSVSMITGLAGIGKGTAYEYFVCDIRKGKDKTCIMRL